jgi:hypothetical protein
MNEPIYFPFTYVPQWVAQALTTAFKQFCVYQPSGKSLPSDMQTWVDEGTMHVCVPVTDEDKNFAEVLRAFQRFAHLHADGKNLKATAFWNRQDAVPFFNDSSPSQIIADLKKDHSGDARMDESEALLRARVFLQFAHEYDRQHAELQQELDDTDRRSKDLLKDLSGHKDDNFPSTRLTAGIKVDEPGEYMAKDRLQAWTRLFLQKPADSGFLVTSSPALLNILRDDLPTAEKLFDAPSLPMKVKTDDAWRETLLDQIKSLIHTDSPAAEHAHAGGYCLEDDSACIRVTLYRIPGCTPAQLFNRLSETSDTAGIQAIQNYDIKNTLIGLIEPNPSTTFNSSNEI